MSDTIFFAAVFPFLCSFIVHANRTIKILIAVAFAYIYATVALISPSEWHHSLLYVNPLIRVTDFVLGIYLALCFLHLKENNTEPFLSNGKVAEMIAIMAVLMLIVEPYLLDGESRLLGPVYWPLITILLLTVSISNHNGGYKLLENKLLQVLGEHSFSIFMIHQLAIRYSDTFFNYFHNDNIILLTIISLIVTIIASILIDNHILKPITQWFSKTVGNNKQQR